MHLAVEVESRLIGQLEVDVKATDASTRLVMPAGSGPGSMSAGLLVQAKPNINARISGRRVNSRQTGPWASYASWVAR